MVDAAAIRGIGALRNAGAARLDAVDVIAFVDADCVANEGWLTTLIPHFDDPRVSAVAPRITPRTGRSTLLARYEATRSALDMGPRPELVTHGAPLGFLPSAALAVRRSSLDDDPFDERLRVGEDVDLVWRLVDSGAMVRYEPAAVVTHEMRPEPLRWAGRIFDYGTSAAELDHRHPGRLAPARLSLLNVAAAALMLAHRPLAGAGALTAYAVNRINKLRAASVDPRAATVVIGKGLKSDAESAGHLLRREWWPIGWLAVASSRRSRVGRAAAAAMLVPLAHEWLTSRPRVDPPRYLLLRLIEDASYGSGVIAGAIRSLRPGVLLPRFRGYQNRGDQKKP